MDGVSTLPIASRLPDQLSEGIGAAGAGTAAASAPHPVALIEARFARQQDANRMALLSRLYGAHLPMKLHMEQVRPTPAFARALADERSERGRIPGCCWPEEASKTNNRTKNNNDGAIAHCCSSRAHAADNMGAESGLGRLPSASNFPDR
jgi:hypothetical protein